MSEMNLPEHWEVGRLGNVCNIVMGQSPPSTTYNDKGVGMPFLQGKAEFTELFPVPIKYCTKQIKVAPKGSVLMSVRAPVGDVNLADRKYIIGRGLTSIGLKRGNNRFLFYLILHNKKEIEAKGYGSIFKSINKTAISDFQIPLPPLPEQRAIAHILQTIQEAKSTRQHEIELESERKAALMDQLFTYGTKSEPRKQTEIGEIPESWEVVKLGDKAELKNGINFKKEQKGQGILTVDVLNMYSDGIYLNTDNLYRVDREARDRDLLQAKDILFVRSSLKQEGVAWASLFDDHEEPVTFCGFLIRARLTTLEIDPEFLTNYFRTTFARKFLVSKSARLAITNVSQAILSSCPIALPSFSEQQEIAEILQACDTKIAALEQETALLGELFHAMLDELMTGNRSAVPLIDREE